MGRMGGGFAERVVRVEGWADGGWYAVWRWEQGLIYDRTRGLMCSTSGNVSEVPDDCIYLVQAHTNTETSKTSAAVGYKHTII
jgi:hypothetical protein